MKKIISLFFLLLFLAGVSHGQQTEQGDNLNLVNSFSRLVYADSAGAAYFLTENKAGDFFIEKQTLHADKPAFTTLISKAQKNFMLSSFFTTANGISFIGSYYDKLTGQTHFSQNTIDWNGKLATPEMVDFHVVAGNKKKGQGSSHICISADHTKRLLTYRVPDSEEMTIYCFDADFRKLYEKQIHFYKNSKRGLFSASDFVVSDEGDFIFHVEKILVKRNGDWEPAEDYIFSVRAESSTQDSALIHTGSASLYTLGFILNKGEVIAFGTTGGKGVEAGTYFARYSISEKKFITESNNALKAEMFVTPGALDKYKGKPFLPARSSIQIFPSSSGFVVIMDAGTYQTTATPTGGTSTMISIYDCQVISLSAEGTVNWVATVFRDHVGTVTSGMLGAYGIATSVTIRKDDFSLYGATSQLIGSEVVMIMNDDPKNVPQPSSTKELSAVRKSNQFAACIIHISAEGKISKEQIAGNYRWHPAYSYNGGSYLYAFYDSAEKAGGVLIH